MECENEKLNSKFLDISKEFSDIQNKYEITKCQLNKYEQLTKLTKGKNKKHLKFNNMQIRLIFFIIFKILIIFNLRNIFTKCTFVLPYEIYILFSL